MGDYSSPLNVVLLHSQCKTLKPARSHCSSLPCLLQSQVQTVGSEVSDEDMREEALRLIAENMELKAKLAELRGVSTELIGLSEAEVMQRLEAGIVWPKPAEGTNFWDLEARTSEMLVGAGLRECRPDPCPALLPTLPLNPAPAPAPAPAPPHPAPQVSLPC